MSVKADNKAHKVCPFDSAKNMVRAKLVPRRARTQWTMSTTKKSYEKFKIKTLLPELKVVEIKKGRQVVRKITARRKTKKFTSRWARSF